MANGTYFIDRCTITREVVVKGPFGASTTQDQLVATDVPCHVVRYANQRGGFTRGSTTPTPAPLTSAMALLVDVPVGTGLRVDDVITLTSKGGDRLAVLSVDTDASWGIMETARVIRVEIEQQASGD